MPTDQLTRLANDLEKILDERSARTDQACRAAISNKDQPEIVIEAHEAMAEERALKEIRQLVLERIPKANGRRRR